jgi:ATP-binding cassette, subfamily F, member 3
MLTVHQLAKSFGFQTLFENITFSIHPGDRTGLVGPNGSGKTTLLRIIAGHERADGGHVAAADGLRTGFLPQGFEYEGQATLGEVVGRAAGDINSLEQELAQLAEGLARRPDDASLQRGYDDLLARVSSADTGRAARILAGLGLGDVPPDLPLAHLSGGQQTRLNLALVLLGDPQLLLLDEPTNHLDIAMLEWLEEWLRDFAGGALIVSHDRVFLDRSAGRILALDPQLKTARLYEGNYSAYVEQRRRERQKQWADYRDQQAELRRIKQDILRAKAQAARTEREASSVRIGGERMKEKGFKDYQQGIAKKVARKAKARESKLERYLESDERVDRPGAQRRLRLDLTDTAHLGKAVVALEDLSVGYAPSKPLLAGLRLGVPAGARIAITGPNGSGKTSLLRTIAGHLPPLAGRVDTGPSVSLGYMTQDQSGLDPALTPLQTVLPAFESETRARTFLGYFLFSGDEPLKPNAQLSHGQRARLALAQMILAGRNVLLLDEPINHLDIPSREQFERALSGFDGTVLAVVHDRYFIERFAGEVWWVENGGIRRSLRSSLAGAKEPGGKGPGLAF